jgi:3-deoxy-D-manno-octulosonate 8-phosphate phosphatase (KDO 8-P phosphatase)
MVPKLIEIEAKKLESIEIVFFDFDGVFTDNFVYVSESGVETIRSSRSDGIGLSRLRDIGIRTHIISTEKNNVVSARAKKLNITCSHGVKDKDEELLKICDNLSINPKNAMFIGNDINDIPAFNVVGIPVGVADSYEEILPHVLYLTLKNGGFGAVREVCDIIFKHNSRLLTNNNL